MALEWRTSGKQQNWGLTEPKWATGIAHTAESRHPHSIYRKHLKLSRTLQPKVNLSLNRKPVNFRTSLTVPWHSHTSLGFSEPHLQKALLPRPASEEALGTCQRGHEASKWGLLLLTGMGLEWPGNDEGVDHILI